MDLHTRVHTSHEYIQEHTHLQTSHMHTLPHAHSYICMYTHACAHSYKQKLVFYFMPFVWKAVSKLGRGPGEEPGAPTPAPLKLQPLCWSQQQGRLKSLRNSKCIPEDEALPGQSETQESMSMSIPAFQGLSPAEWAENREQGAALSSTCGGSSRHSPGLGAGTSASPT